MANSRSRVIVGGMTALIAASILGGSVPAAAAGRSSQAIYLTSSAFGTVLVGGSYTPTAVAAPSNLPVTFTIDASSTPGACEIGGGVVSFTGAGTCVIDANQAGDADYTPAPQTQERVTVVALNTATGLVVSGSALTATVTGGGPVPSGAVVFSVDGRAVGSVELSGGRATLGHSFAPGQTYAVTAQYQGDSAYTASSDTTSYTAPPPATKSTQPPATKHKQAPLKITLKLTSSRPEQHGWWTAPVTARFSCTRAGRRVAKCLRPVRLATSGNHVVNGHKIDIDLSKPSLRIVGLNAGATYLVAAPAPGCHAQDAISGIRKCRISERVIGRAPGEQTVRFTAQAINGAGTTTSRSVTVSEQQLGLIGVVSSATGIYAVNTGRNYTLEVASRTKPLYVEGAVAPQLPAGAHDWFVLNGHRGGVPLWELNVLLPSGLPQNAYWNIGVRIGNRTRIFAIRD